MQAAAIRNRLRALPWQLWILGTTLATVVGLLGSLVGAFAVVVATEALTTDTQRLALSTTPVIAGATVGAAQHHFLRALVRHAGWWIAASAVAALSFHGVIWEITSAAGRFAFDAALGDALRSLALTGALRGGIYGIATATLLTWLLSTSAAHSGNGPTGHRS